MDALLNQQLRTVVIPAAGLGTRFLPATKAVPKEMLPIVDTPAIQLIVEEAVASGAQKVVLIAGRHKQAIEDHFDHAFELEHTLEQRHKTADLEQLRRIASMAKIVSLRQQAPLGLGHAVLCAQPVVGQEYFGVMLGDDLVDSEVPCLLQLWQAHLKYKKSVIALMPVPLSETSMYGIAAGRPLSDSVWQIEKLVEKPKGNPPSQLAVIGRYILTPSVFEILQQTKAGVGGEIQLTDALAVLAQRGELIGVTFTGQRHDVGDKMGYVQATVAYALKRPELRNGLMKFLEMLVNPT